MIQISRLKKHMIRRFIRKVLLGSPKALKRVYDKSFFRQLIKRKELEFESVARQLTDICDYPQENTFFMKTLLASRSGHKTKFHTVFNTLHSFL